VSDKCLICGSDVETPMHQGTPKGGSESGYSCPRCGDYWLDSQVEHHLSSVLQQDNRKIACISHWIRTKNEALRRSKPNRTPIVTLTNELIDTILRQPSPTPAEQADKFVLWLGSKIPSPGEKIQVKPSTDISIIGAQTPRGLVLVIRHLIDSELITCNKDFVPLDQAHISLSFKGWQYYEKIKQGDINSRKAFMAMKYGDEQLDKIVDDVFKPAVKQTGFDLVRLDDRPKAGLIDDRLRVEIQTSRFLIADLTHDNLGAYWEAGYAEGLGKSVIYTCEKSKFEKDPPHFDTNHHLTIPWDEKNPQEATEKLKATIRATLPEAAKLTDD